MLKNLAKATWKAVEVQNSFSSSIFTVQKRLAGHSKWQNIRHIKGAKDAQRSALFTRLSRMMKVAITEGGSADAKANLKLEQVLEQAKRANMPNATVQSVLKSCQSDKSNSKSYMLEFKGPGGAMFLCEVFTPNLHQLRQNIATILKKNQAKYTDGSSLLHMFEQKGIVEAEILQDCKGKAKEEILELTTEHAIESGAEDVQVLDDDITVQFVCAETSLKSVVADLEKLHYQITSASVEYCPVQGVELGEAEMNTCANLYEKLEALPEVVRVSSNIV